MNQLKFDQLKHDIACLDTQTAALSKEILKYCMDLGVKQEDYEDLLQAFSEARGHGLSSYEIKDARWKDRIKGREFNAKVFAEKHLGREVRVEAHGREDGYDGTGIVCGYIHIPTDGYIKREYPYVMVDLPANAYSKYKIGNATAGVFSASSKTYHTLRDAAGFYYWNPEELVLVDSAPLPVTTGDCQCGAAKCGGFHSKWCPKYK